MKQLYLVAGTMGAGKTTVCQALKGKLAHSVFLDGDWCWDMHPFQVTDETKEMVMQNICFLLNSFLHCSAFEHIIFCWVMHEQAIFGRASLPAGFGKLRSARLGSDLLRKRFAPAAAKGY